MRQRNPCELAQYLINQENIGSIDLQDFLNEPSLEVCDPDNISLD